VGKGEKTRGRGAGKHKERGLGKAGRVRPLGEGERGPRFSIVLRAYGVRWQLPGSGGPARHCNRTRIRGFCVRSGVTRPRRHCGPHRHPRTRIGRACCRLALARERGEGGTERGPFVRGGPLLNLSSPQTSHLPDATALRPGLRGGRTPHGALVSATYEGPKRARGASHSRVRAGDTGGRGGGSRCANFAASTPHTTLKKSRRLAFSWPSAGARAPARVGSVERMGSTHPWRT
jgi:hypothetical protein